MIDRDYSSIIGEEWPQNKNSKRARMPLDIRAKIFLPFAALKGYKEAIESQQRIVVPKSELSDDMKDTLDMKLSVIKEQLSKSIHPMITIVYFKKSHKSDEGEYLRLSGMVSKLDAEAKYIQIVTSKISIDDIFDINGDIFI